MAIIQFRGIPLANVTNTDLQLDNWECMTEPLHPNDATVVDCNSPGVWDPTNDRYYAWVNNRTMNTPTFCTFTACTANHVVMTCWTPPHAIAAGKPPIPPEKFTAEVTKKPPGVGKPR